MLQKLKKKWGISSNFDFVAIFMTFSFAGMTVSFCRKPIFLFFGITHGSPFWLKVLVYIPFVFPIYQISLIIIGTLLGQFSFFWEKEKKLARWFGKVLGIKKPA